MFSAALKHVMTGQSSLTVPGDPLLASNVLLLKTVGRNNLTNAEFLDSSNDQFSVTRTGDVTQGAFSPYVPTGYWSGYFDGSGDYLSIPSSTQWQFGTGAFCIEFWVNPQAWTANATYAVLIRTTGGANGFLVCNHQNQLIFHIPNVGNILSASLPPTALWSHVAVCRNSNTVSMFVNGVRVATASSSHDMQTSSLHIGGGTDWNTYVQAHISNMRLVKGNSVYDPTQTTITVPQQPLTAISGTALLCLQDNRFIDRSSNNFTLTQVGDVSVRRFAPFGLSWDGSLGGSAYFDGSGDYLNLGNQTALKLDSGNFTVEAWIWKNANTSYMTLSGDYSAGTNTSCIAADATGTKICWVAANTQSFILTSTASIPVGAWTHIAFVRSSGTLSLYINGALDSSVADSRTYSGTNQYYVGIDAQLISGREWNGFISNYRVVKGSAVYTANFTPPTTPLTAITNTSLLLNFNNAAVYDATRSSNLTLNGTTQTSTAQKNYADTSVSLSTAAGNRGLQTVDRPELRFGTGDFTAELWWRPSGLSGYQTIINKGYNATGGFALQTELNNGRINVVLNGPVVITAPANRAVTDATWNHIALVRSAGTVTLWVNGLSAGSASSSADLSSTADLQIGWETQGGNAYPASGNIEDVRFSRTARYTSAFTPPARALPVSVVGVSAPAPAPFSASGGTVTTSGVYTVHTFTSSGSFVVSGTTPKDVEYLVVGGGGGGGGYIGGGGGGGGVRTGTMSINAGTYTVTVGAGGNGGLSVANAAGDGSNGENSVFSTITAAGGGGGAAAYSRSGKNGGSGGGGSNGSGLAGSGNTPSRSPAQGNNGGAGGPDTNYGSGGGGGAGSAGNAGAITGGAGGTGVGSAISGTQTGYGGGGGGASYFSTGGAGGGSGGGYGGAGTGSNTPYLPIAGTANRGGGGGGGAITNYPDLTTGPGAPGGSGIVIVRYLT